MKRVQNKHRRSAKKHLRKNKSKSRSRKYKGGIPGGQGLDYPITTHTNSGVRYVHGSSIPASQIQMPPPGYSMGAMAMKGPAPK